MSNFFIINRALSVRYNDLSPLSYVRNSGITEKFHMKLYFKKLCKCKNENNFVEKCHRCIKYFEKEYDIWRKIKKIIEVCNFF